MCIVEEANEGVEVWLMRVLTDGIDVCCIISVATVLLILHFIM